MILRAFSRGSISLKGNYPCNTRVTSSNTLIINTINREEQENGELENDYEACDSDDDDEDEDDEEDDTDSGSDGEKDGVDDLRDLVKELAAMGIPGKSPASPSTSTPSQPTKITISHTPSAPSTEVCLGNIDSNSDQLTIYVSPLFRPSLRRSRRSRVRLICTTFQQHYQSLLRKQLLLFHNSRSGRVVSHLRQILKMFVFSRKRSQ